MPDLSDQSPSVKAAGRPSRVLPAVYADQSDPCGDADQSVVARAAPFGGAPEAPPGVVAPRAQGCPPRVADVLSVGPSPPGVPRFPLCALGMSPSELERVSPHVEPQRRRGESFEMGRRPCDSRLFPAWRALSEVFAPLERLVGPASRRLLRISGGALGGDGRVSRRYGRRRLQRGSRDARYVIGVGGVGAEGRVGGLCG